MGDFLTKPLDLVAAQYGMRDIVDKVRFELRRRHPRSSLT